MNERASSDRPFDAAGLDIRPAREADIRDVAELWVDAFPSRRTVEDRIRTLERGGRYGGLESVVVARERDGMVGAYKSYRLEEHVAGVVMPMMGLAAVAVEPSRRRRGLGARLCTHAINEAADRGDVVSVLYPFRPDYYERLGWGLVGGFLEYRFHTAALPRYAGAAAVRPAEPGDLERIAACYERATAGSNGPIRRNRAIWGHRLSARELGVRNVPDPELGGHPEGRPRTVVYDRDGVTGYALLRYSRPGAPAHRLDVRELIAESEAAYRGLLGYLAERHDPWATTRHIARFEERFGDRLHDARPPGHRRIRSLYFPTARFARGPMLRVLDLPAALRRRDWTAGGGVDARLRLRVEDPQRPRNHGPWAVRIRGDSTEVEEDRAGGQADAELAADAATFARIFVGEIPPTDAARLGRASVGGDAALLDRVFGAPERFWLLDEF